jgi:4-amino-4-deoxy-L-arabinose transferase-like glycosyltransferase
MKRIVSSVEKQFKENKELMIGLGFFLFYLAMINLPPLLEPDEGRYIEIPREMLALRDFILPHLNGVLYFEKPPLYYWLNSLSVAIFGISLVAARIWSVIMAVLTILFTGKLARRFFGREAGVTAEIILGSSFLFMGLACFNTLDMTLTFFLTACIGCFFLATSSDRRNLNFWLMQAPL